MAERVEFKKIMQGDEREDEMEENLDAVMDILGDLKAQSTAMGEELDRQVWFHFLLHLEQLVRGCDRRDMVE